MPLVIRPAQEADIPVLASFAANSFTDTFGYLYSMDNLNHHLRRTCSEDYFTQAITQDFILLAFDDEQLVGYAKYGELGLPVVQPPKNSSELHRLYVLRSHQNKKIGAALIEQILESSFIKQSVVTYLGVWENNQKAQRFYSKYGFKPVGEYMYPVGTQLDREIIMARIA